MTTRSLLGLVMARSVRILVECFLVLIENEELTQAKNFFSRIIS